MLTTTTLKTVSASPWLTLTCVSMWPWICALVRAYSASFNRQAPSSVLLINVQWCSSKHSGHENLDVSWVSVPPNPLPSPTTQSGRRIVLMDGAIPWYICKHTSPWRWFGWKTVLIQQTQTNFISTNNGFLFGGGTVRRLIVINLIIKPSMGAEHTEQEGHDKANYWHDKYIFY